MFVLLTWVLEAASSCYVEESDGIWRTKGGAVLKPHLIALLRYVPIDLREQGKDTFSAEEDGSRRTILTGRGRVRSPWNLALVVSAALGGALGAGLAHATPGCWPEAIAVSVSLAAAGLLAYFGSQKKRLAVSVVTAVVLIGVISPYGDWPFGILAAGPWLAITFLYLMFRGSSYQDLKEFGPNLLKTLAAVRLVLKLGPGLLHIAIGEKAWLAAGFADGPATLEDKDALMRPQPAASTIVMPDDTGSRDPTTPSDLPPKDNGSGPHDR